MQSRWDWGAEGATTAKPYREPFKASDPLVAGVTAQRALRSMVPTTCKFLLMSSTARTFEALVLRVKKSIATVAVPPHDPRP
jgi:hypothetical protein